VNLGPLAGVGMAAGLDSVRRRRLAAQGFRLLEVEDVLTALHDLLVEDATQAALLAMDWQRWAAQSAAPSPLPEALSGPAASPTDPGEALAELPPTRRRARLEELVRQHLAEVLGMSSARTVEPRHRLFDLGIDSLLAVELKNRLEALLGRPLGATLVFDFPTVADLVTHLASLLDTDVSGQETPPTRPAPAPPPPATPTDAADLDTLSEHELAALLARELGRPPPD